MTRLDGVRVKQQVHVLILTVFVGPCPDGKEGCHDPDPDRTNNRLANLRWGTRQDNADDRVRLGRQAKGAKVASSVLTDADVVGIWKLVVDGVPYRRIGDRYGVSKATVSAITTGLIWTHVPRPQCYVRKKKKRVDAGTRRGPTPASRPPPTSDHARVPVQGTFWEGTEGF